MTISSSLLDMSVALKGRGSFISKNSLIFFMKKHNQKGDKAAQIPTCLCKALINLVNEEKINYSLPDIFTMNASLF